MGKSQRANFLGAVSASGGSAAAHGDPIQVVLGGLQRVYTNTPAEAVDWFYDPHAGNVVYVYGDSISDGY